MKKYKFKIIIVFIALLLFLILTIIAFGPIIEKIFIEKWNSHLLNSSDIEKRWESAQKLEYFNNKTKLFIEEWYILKLNFGDRLEQEKAAIRLKSISSTKAIPHLINIIDKYAKSPGQIYTFYKFNKLILLRVAENLNIKIFVDSIINIIETNPKEASHYISNTDRYGYYVECLLKSLKEEIKNKELMGACSGTRNLGKAQNLNHKYHISKINNTLQ